MLSKPRGDSVYTRVLYRTSITRVVLLEETVNGPIYNVAGWGAAGWAWHCVKWVLRLRALTPRSRHRGSHTGAVARGSGVAGTAFKGRVEVVNGFL